MARGAAQGYSSPAASDDPSSAPEPKAVDALYAESWREKATRTSWPNLNATPVSHCFGAVAVTHSCHTLCNIIIWQESPTHASNVPVYEPFVALPSGEMPYGTLQSQRRAVDMVFKALPVGSPGGKTKVRTTEPPRAARDYIALRKGTFQGPPSLVAEATPGLQTRPLVYPAYGDQPPAATLEELKETMKTARLERKHREQAKQEVRQRDTYLAETKTRSEPDHKGKEARISPNKSAVVTDAFEATVPATASRTMMHLSASHGPDASNGLDTRPIEERVSPVALNEAISSSKQQSQRAVRSKGTESLPPNRQLHMAPTKPKANDSNKSDINNTYRSVTSKKTSSGLNQPNENASRAERLAQGKPRLATPCSDLVRDQTQASLGGTREAAMARFDALDLDGNGVLEGGEVLLLAEWVWCSFRPGQQITKDVRRAEAVKILKRCDRNESGGIDRAEFEVYYTQIVNSISRFNEAQARKKDKRKKEVGRRPNHTELERFVDVAPPLQSHQVLDLVTSDASLEFDKLDFDSNGRLERHEVGYLAEWVWCSFRPGQRITPKERESETEKLLRRCDTNGDGWIDREVSAYL